MSTKKYQMKNVGEIHKTKDTLGGYDCEIIDGGSKPSYVKIQIEDWVAEKRIDNVRTGKIKYPNHPSVHGIGFVGEGSCSQTKNKQLYDSWNSMLGRCYNPMTADKYPTYFGIVTVDPDWLNLQKFGLWYDANHVDGYDIDKDLLSGDSKIYSEDTCLFIPKALNLFLATKYANNITGFVGIYLRSSGRFQARIRIYDHKTGTSTQKTLGTYDTAQEASDAYEAQRSIEAQKWKDATKGILPQKAIDNIK